jgi:flagellar basal-body rod modification protein FlgD
MSALSGMGTSAQEISTNYIKLLVTQLQNQDPTQPMDNNQMASELAQLSSLQQLENMGGTFSQVLTSQQAVEATSLIGKQITFFPAGAKTAQSGRVDGVDFSSGAAKLTVGGQIVDMSTIATISEGSAAS